VQSLTDKHKNNNKQTTELRTTDIRTKTTS